jgi:hypothetical protein
VVMDTASLCIQVDSMHRGMIFGHIYKVDEAKPKESRDRRLNSGGVE